MLRINPRILCFLFLGLIDCSGKINMTSKTRYGESQSAQEPDAIDASKDIEASKDSETSKDSEASPLTTLVPDDPDSTVAIEPATIGGAYLNCHYRDNAKLGDSQYTMDCSLNLPTAVPVQTATATFSKVDTEGRRYPLEVIQETLNPLSWVINEKAETYFLKTTEATTKINDGNNTIYRTEVKTPALMLQGLTYWLGGEPNNQKVKNMDEDCIEYQNLTTKNSFESVTGLPSGPLGRMNDEVCTTSQNFLCKNIHDKSASKWLVSTTVGPYSAYATACPAGFRFAMPMGQAEFLEVNALLDQKTTFLKVWTPLQDRVKEGEYRILF